MDSERRARRDRRQHDSGPPKEWRDRRRHTERRLPAAEETEISADDFAMYFGSGTKIANNNDHLLDQASEVFDRARDRY